MTKYDKLYKAFMLFQLSLTLEIRKISHQLIGQPVDVAAILN